tara:strand:- start:2921 stop:5245 length:2325 start_codon:yes stop_codon:yes gene_type:complete
MFGLIVVRKLKILTSLRKSILSLTMGCALLGIMLPPIAAQDQEISVIQSITVLGNQRIERSTIMSYVSVAKGSSFDPVLIDRSLKDLFATGLFADVNISREGETLIINVSENPIINRIVFEGNKRIKDSTLEAEVSLRPRVVYTRTKIQKDLTRLLQLYRSSGRFSAQIEPRIIELEQNRVDLVYEIVEGEQTGIQRILFVGNKNFSNKKLREIIRTKETRWWRFLSTDDTYDPDRINYDGELLRRFYLNNGFADFQVKTSISELRDDKSGFFVTFILDEGRRYKIGDISINSSLEEVDVLPLGRLVETRKGDWYNFDSVESSIQELTKEIGQQGHAFVEVLPRVERDRAAGTIAIAYDVGEGQRVYVERVEITGNVRTLDRVIRRNVRIAEGDAFNAAKVRRSKQLIEELGFFKNVDIQHMSGSAPDRSELQIHVQEQSTGELTFGAGLSSDSGVIGSAGIREKNLLGRGQNLSLQFQLSGLDQNIEASLDEPYFLNREVSAGFDLYNTKREFRESSFDRDLIGFGVRASYPLGEFLHQQVRYGLRNEEIIPSRLASSIVIANAGESLVSTLGQSIFYKQLDNKLNPKDGYFVGLVSDLAGLGGDRKWLKNKIEAGVYKKLWADDWIGSLTGEIGFISGFSGETVSISDRFFLGGQNFRGFKSGGVGPRDLSTDNTVGGNILYQTTAQMSVPLGLPRELGLSGRAFTTFGSLTKVDEASSPSLQDTGSLRASVGIGLAWDSPFGPISLNYARPVLSETFDETEYISFGIGSMY